MPRAFAISFIRYLWSTYVYMTTVNIQGTGGISQGWGVTCHLCLLDICCPWGWEEDAKPSTVAFTAAFLSQLRHTSTQPSPSAALSLTWLRMAPAKVPCRVLPERAPRDPAPGPAPKLHQSQSQGSLQAVPCRCTQLSAQVSATCCSTSPPLNQPWENCSGLIPHCSYGKSC